MAKLRLDEKIEGLELFLSIYRGNNTQSKIVSDLNLKIKRTYPSLGSVNGKNIKYQSPTNISEKLTTLVNYHLIRKVGKNRWTKYQIDFEGIVHYIIIDIILPSIFEKRTSKELKTDINELIRDITLLKDFKKITEFLVTPELFHKYSNQKKIINLLNKIKYSNVINNNSIHLLIDQSIKYYNNFFSYLKSTEFDNFRIYSIRDMLKKFVIRSGFKREAHSYIFKKFTLCSTTKNDTKPSVTNLTLTIFFDACSHYFRQKLDYTSIKSINQ